MHATIKQNLIEKYEPLLREFHLYAIKNFIVAKNRMKFKTTNAKYKLLLLEQHAWQSSLMTHSHGMCSTSSLSKTLTMWKLSMKHFLYVSIFLQSYSYYSFFYFCSLIYSLYYRCDWKITCKGLSSKQVNWRPHYQNAGFDSREQGVNNYLFYTIHN